MHRSMLALTLILLLAVFLLFALPGVAAIVEPRAGPFAAFFYPTLLVGLALTHLGLSMGGPVPVIAPPPGQVPALCGRAIDTAQSGGLILGRPDPDRLIVDRDLWAQVPEAARAGLLNCLEAGRPASSRGRPIEIVERGER